MEETDYPAQLKGRESLQYDELKTVIRKFNSLNIPVALYEDEQQLIVTHKPDQILEELEWAVMMGILSFHRKYIQIHASGLSRNCRELLLSGPPGSGKTTLALILNNDIKNENRLVRIGEIEALSLVRRVSQPMGRSGKLFEVADLVCYLASDRDSYITGTVINITGGKTRV